MGAAVFTTVEVWTRRGLVTYCVLIVIKLSSRRIEIVGITPNPDASWVQQAARNLVDTNDGFLLDTKYILLDRDKKFLPFADMLESADMNIVFLPPRSPNLNAYIERFMRSIKSECLDKVVFFGENSLWQALNELEQHYQRERNHQGLGNNIIDFRTAATSTNSPVQRQVRLGGLLNYYHREPA